MSYDVSFRVKVEGIEDCYVEPACNTTDANITWNVREMIVKSTGLENWTGEGVVGLCSNVMPCIAKGYAELCQYPEKYKQYEALNGWGTVEGCKRFFATLVKDWTRYCEDYSTRDLAAVTYFYIC